MGLDAEAADWLGRMRDGDVAAFEEMLRALGRPLYRYALGMVHDSGTAEDRVQDTLRKFVTALRAGHEISELRGYLFQSLRNTCLNYLRDRKRGEHGVERYREMLAENLSCSATQLQTTASLYHALGCLPQEQSDVILLRLNGDFPFQEIATLLGENINTVYKRYQSGIQRLREALA